MLEAPTELFLELHVGQSVIIPKFQGNPENDTLTAENFILRNKKKLQGDIWGKLGEWGPHLRL